MTTRYLAVFLPRLPTDRLQRLRGGTVSGAPEPEGSCGSAPLATLHKVKGAQRIAAVDAAAEAAGIRPGVTLADARAMLPGLKAAEADPAADAVLLKRITAWCSRFTPLAAPDGRDGILLDIAGVDHLFGGTAPLLAAVQQGLRAQGFAVQGAIAATPEAAAALARYRPGTIAPASGDPEGLRLLLDLPVAALRLEDAALRSLAQAGLRRIGDLELRPRAPIAARFGAGVLARLDAMLGRTKSSIEPQFEVPPYLAERRFASGLVETAAVEAALLPLCRHLCRLMEQHEEGARVVEASLFRVDGAVKRIVIGTSRPVRAPEALLALFRLKLAGLTEEGLEAGYGFELIRLGVSRAEPLRFAQEVLLDDAALAARPAGTRPEDLAELADRLGAKLGPLRVLRLRPGASHHPERAMLALPASGFEAAAEAQGAAGGRAAEADPAELCRPIRLFERPEPIETIAAVPDGPPVRFRWRQILHEIAAIEGPERIAPEWWRAGDALTRDYFRAEDREGRMFWLFREGLFNREVTAARWFLHGLFG